MFYFLCGKNRDDNDRRYNSNNNNNKNNKCKNDIIKIKILT